MEMLLPQRGTQERSHPHSPISPSQFLPPPPLSSLLLLLLLRVRRTVKEHCTRPPTLRASLLRYTNCVCPTGTVARVCAAAISTPSCSSCSVRSDANDGWQCKQPVGGGGRWEAMRRDETGVKTGSRVAMHWVREMCSLEQCCAHFIPHCCSSQHHLPPHTFACHRPCQALIPHHCAQSLTNDGALPHVMDALLRVVSA